MTIAIAAGLGSMVATGFDPDSRASTRVVPTAANFAGNCWMNCVNVAAFAVTRDFHTRNASSKSLVAKLAVLK